MKAKKIVAVMAMMAIVESFSSVSAYADTIQKIKLCETTQMTWKEISTTKFDEKYPMVEELVEGLCKFEDGVNKTATMCYGGLNAATFKEEYPICKHIANVFSKETGIKVNIRMDRLCCDYAQLRISTSKKDDELIGKVGDCVEVGEGTSYYESAWDWGSGKSYWIKEGKCISPNMKADVIAIAKLDDYGKVTSISYSKDTPIMYENTMILIGVNNIPIGWVTPTTI